SYRNRGFPLSALNHYRAIGSEDFRFRRRIITEQPDLADFSVASFSQTNLEK
ncbi:hypothetical protein CHS0354_036334, partial [Potamilus streckersoni]